MQYLDTKQYGKRVKEIREQRNMTQVNLATAVGYSDARQIQRIEAGESAGKIDTVVEIAQVLNVSTDYLLYGKATSYDSKIAELLVGKTPEEQEFAYMMLQTLFANKDLLAG